MIEAATSIGMSALSRDVDACSWISLVAQQSSLGKPPMWMVIVGVLGVGVVVGLIAIASAQSEKKRRRAIKAELATSQFDVVVEPTDDDKAAAFSSLGKPWAELPRGSKGVNWFARISRERDVTLIEHSYTTSSGKSSSTHYHTIAATGAPADWPVLTLSRENIFHKIGSLLGMKDLEVEDPEFNKRWRIKSAHEDFALLVLTPEIQKWAMSIDGTLLTIRIGGGVVTLCRHRTLKPEEYLNFVDDCLALAGLIPPELDAWVPVSGASGVTGTA
jgi:hypothetical protein